MKEKTKIELDKMFVRHPELVECENDIIKIIEFLVHSFRQNNKLLICGNGGSASDAQHITAELAKSFKFIHPLQNKFKDELQKYTTPADFYYLVSRLQKGLPVISLVDTGSLITAISNDVSGDLIFAQQVFSYSDKETILLVISTTGNSKNIIYACQVAKALGLTIIGLTGKGGGLLTKYCDMIIKAPEIETYLVQEKHIIIYHAICSAIENEIFGE